jgi:hypothetical protein
VTIKRLILSSLVTVGVCGALAAPGLAQNQQEGLVNVAVEDVTIQLPIAVAANVCDVNVAVLAEVADQGGTCRGTADSAASAGPSGNGSTRQEGLVNVLIDDVVVQVPVALAANICDVNVAVLAEIADEPAACRAVANAEAQQPGGGGGGQAASAEAFDPIDLDLDLDGQIDLDVFDVLNNNLGDSNPDPLPGPVVDPGTRRL